MKVTQSVLLGAAILFSLARADAAGTKLVAEGFESPVAAIMPPGDTRFFVVERSGAIKILDPATGQVAPEPFLVIQDLKSGGEQGLLGLAFHPDYAINGYFYVDLTNEKGDTEIRRYQKRPGVDHADASSKRVLLEIDQPYANHNGGWIAFGPDKYLYISMGDGGAGNDPHRNAQNLNALLGKLLRIDVNNPSIGKAYGIPGDNPFARGGGAPEIWAYGLRNAWRCSFDRLTGSLWMGDVGQNRIEEIDFQRVGTPGGRNYGWRAREGNEQTKDITDPAPPNAVPPIHTYRHERAPNGGGSVTGGYVYRGTEIPELVGEYFFADFSSNQIWALRYRGGVVQGVVNRTNELKPKTGAPIQQISSFAEDANGELYIISLTGSIHRLVPDAVANK
jgi:glucose/arabinose dehydrogenase